MNTQSEAKQPVIERGEGAYLLGTDGRRYLDLINGFGSVFLGHADPDIAAAIGRQAATLVNVGRLDCGTVDQAAARLSGWLPASMHLGGIYSTGMEAVEFALRVAASNTGKTRFVSFGRSMHGKSVATANLGWDNTLLGWGEENRLEFPLPEEFSATLDAVEALLVQGHHAAVIMEPIQGSHDGRSLTIAQMDELAALCRRHGVLSIVDETLTGMYRTGLRFYTSALARPPDLMVFAKALGNGFPLSAVAVGAELRVHQNVLPGSTFSATPLASAVVVSVLDGFERRQVADCVEHLGEAVLSSLGPGADLGNASLRGQGALWLLRLGSAALAQRVQRRLFDAGALIGRMGDVVRILPQAGTDPAELRHFCEVIAACSKE